MAFFVIEPVAGIDGVPTFPRRSYPREETFDTIRQLDPVSDSYRIPEDLFGGEFLCLLHGNGTHQLLGAYYRDNLGKLLTEYKGEISEAMLREGEAPVDGSYAIFFPDDIVGLLRTSPKSPGHARISQWLSFVAGCPCQLIPLRDPDALAQLRRQPSGIRRLVLGARKNTLAEIEGGAPNVAAVLRTAARVHPSSDMVRYEVVAEQNHKEEFSRLTLQMLEDLIDTIPLLEEVKVTVSGRQRPINLKRLHVTGQIDVTLVNTSRVGPSEAPDVVHEAYEQELLSIRQAVAVHWSAGDTPPILG